jgi:hypothetical protein
MPTTPEPVPLNSSHRDTLAKLFEHPVSHNIEWHDVESLLQQAGTVEERHDGKFAVKLGSETRVFERPRHKDINVDEVVELRRMLANAGFEP